MILNDAVRQALTSGHHVTLNADGSPQVSLVWVDLDGDEIVCAHLGSRKKVKNIQQEARAALSMETGGKSGILANAKLSGEVGKVWSLRERDGSLRAIDGDLLARRDALYRVGNAYHCRNAVFTGDARPM